MLTQQSGSHYNKSLGIGGGDTYHFVNHLSCIRLQYKRFISATLPAYNTPVTLDGRGGRQDFSFLTNSSFNWFSDPYSICFVITNRLWFWVQKAHVTSGWALETEVGGKTWRHKLLSLNSFHLYLVCTPKTKKFPSAFGLESWSSFQRKEISMVTIYIISLYAPVCFRSDGWTDFINFKLQDVETNKQNLGLADLVLSSFPLPSGGG